MSESVETYQAPIPAAVRRSTEAANELMRQLAAGQPPEGEATASPAVEPPPGQGAGDQPPPPAADQGAEPAAAPPAGRKPVDWQQRFNTLQGKYNSELPAAVQRAVSAEAREAEQRGLVADLRRQLAAVPAAATAKASPAQVDPADVETYGQELIDRSRQWARSEFEPVIEQLRQEVATLRQNSDAVRQNVQQVSQQTAQDRVHAALDVNVPGWRAQNDDPGFIAWLDEEEGLSGRKRKDILGPAYVSGDTNRVVRIFKAYGSEHTDPTPAAATTPSHTPRAGAGQVPLASLAAPGRGTPASPGAQPEKRIWTHNQIAAFYRDCTDGKYAHREADRARIEADIFAAAPEGRVR